MPRYYGTLRQVHSERRMLVAVGTSGWRFCTDATTSPPPGPRSRMRSRTSSSTSSGVPFGRTCWMSMRRSPLYPCASLEAPLPKSERRFVGRIRARCIPAATKPRSTRSGDAQYQRACLWQCAYRPLSLPDRITPTYPCRPIITQSQHPGPPGCPLDVGRIIRRRSAGRIRPYHRLRQRRSPDRRLAAAPSPPRSRPPARPVGAPEPAPLSAAAAPIRAMTASEDHTSSDDRRDELALAPLLYAATRSAAHSIPNSRRRARAGIVVTGSQPLNSYSAVMACSNSSRGTATPASAPFSSG